MNALPVMTIKIESGSKSWHVTTWVQWPGWVHPAETHSPAYTLAGAIQETMYRAVTLGAVIDSIIVNGKRWTLQQALTKAGPRVLDYQRQDIERMIQRSAVA